MPTAALSEPPSARPHTPPQAQPPSRWLRRLGAAALLGALAAVYAPVLGFQWLEMDDLTYVLHNPHLGTGLSAATTRWALTSTYFGWWHPLTWLSHLVDVRLFGYAPGGHHATSAVLHAANALLGLALARRLGFSPGRALLATALAFLHPTRVESVAWISERKDVLAATFFLLTLHAWLSFRRHGGRARYAGVLAALALGLASKAMLVTLPVLLLLLERWRPPGARLSWRRLAALLAPLFALSVAAGLAVIATQRALGAAQPLDVLPLELRLRTVALAYATYLKLTLWPLELSPYYERYVPTSWQWLGALALITAVAGALWALRRRLPHLAWATAAAAVLLVPVIGIIQVGGQLVADRYLYLPHLALAAGLAGSVPRDWLQRRPLLTGGAAFALVAWLAALSYFQVHHWRDTETLFRHGLSIEPHSEYLNTTLGLHLYKAERHQEAIPYLEAVAARSPFAQATLARARLALGERTASLRSLAHAAARAPADDRITRLHSGAYAELGAQAAQAGHLAQAAALLERALALDGRNLEARRLLELAREDLARASAPTPRPQQPSTTALPAPTPPGASP